MTIEKFDQIWKQSLLVICASLTTGAVYGQTSSSTIVAGPAVSTSVAVDFASSYVFRGQTVNRRSSVQPNVSLAVADRAELGVWGNFPVEREAEELKQEVDIYLTYAIPIGIGDLVLGATEYMYPDDEIENDRELQFAVALDTILSPTISAFVGIGGGINNSQYYEFSLDQELWQMENLTFNLGGALGYASPEEGDAGFSHALITLATGYDILNASANWVIETDDRINDLSGQENFFLTVGTGYSF